MSDEVSYPLYKPSMLDEPQILRGAYDEETQRLRVDSNISIADLTIDVDLDPDEDGVYIGDRDTGIPLKVNANGSINVVTGTVNRQLASVYNEVTGIVAGITTIIGQIVLSENALLQKIDFSGSNIAEFELVIDGNTEDKKRTYFGSSLNGTFDFNQGLALTSGQTVTVYVVHNRPSVGDFNSRMQFLED